MNYLEYLLGLLQKKSVQVGCIIILTLLAYSSIFPNRFAWDDQDTVINWQAKREWSSIPNFLRGDAPPGHQGNYRPLRNILYIVDHKIFGVHPFGYHLQSVAIEISASLLLYLITRRITNHPYLPFFTALLFALHPVHVEAVTWITSSMDMFGVVFMLGSLYLYIRARESKRYFWLHTALSLCCATLAFFTNEVTLTLPGLVLLVDHYFLRPKSSLYTKIVSMLPFAIVDGLYLAVRYFIAGQGARASYIFNDPKVHFFVMLKAFIRYLEVLIYPVQLTINHSLGSGITSWLVELERASLRTKQLTLALSFFHPEVFCAIIIVVGTLYLAWRQRKTMPILSFAIVWFYMSFVTTLNIIPTEAIMVERFAYVPSYGFILLFVYLVVRTFGVQSPKIRRRTTQLGWGILIVTTLLYGYRTFIRNMDWKNDEILWTRTVTVNPEAMLARLYLANIYLSRGNLDAGLKHYQLAYKINPNYPDVTTTLGIIYESKGDSQKALEFLTQRSSLLLSEGDRLTMIANAYRQMGKYELSIETYKKLTLLTPKDSTLYNNLGAVYAMAGQYDLARSAFLQALKLKPDLESAQANLAKLDSAMKRN